ncbi:MAG: PepSY-associated TM helix domain-containing protein [Bacteroidota bacterium]
MNSKKKTPKYWIAQVHLWLGLTSGLFVCFLGITGCILAFEREIEDATQSYRFVKTENKPYLSPTVLKSIADKKIPGKHAHSVSYQKGNASAVTYYAFGAEEYYWMAYLNPYTGGVLKVKDMDDDFFRIVINGHYYLWLPPNIGQPVLASATLMFLFLLISGLFLWWPKNKAASKKRFTIKWNAKWKRLNYDLHNVFGFYMTWILIFIAFSGLVMGFQWFSQSAYWVTSGGKKLNLFEESLSDSTLVNSAAGKKPAIDFLWAKTMNMVSKRNNFTGSVEIHVPDSPKSSIEVAINPDTETYWKADYLYYDQYTLKEIEVAHVFGKFANATVADKLMRANYDIHIGAVAGLPGKIMAFLASLIAASLPITGFIIWWGRKKKIKK